MRSNEEIKAILFISSSILVTRSLQYVEAREGQGCRQLIEETRLRAHLVVLSTGHFWGGRSCLITEAA